MANQTFSAPLALIRSNGVTIGKMRNIRCTETQRRQMVKGIGKITDGESVITDWTGTLNCGAFTMDLRKSIIPGSTLRVAQTAQQWEDTVTLNDLGIQIVILRKVAKTVLASGMIVPDYVPFVTIESAFTTSEDFDITEGQVSGRNCSFEYTRPYIFPQ